MGELSALTAAFLWAITSTLLRAIGQEGSALWVGVVRLWAASLIIGVVALASGQWAALGDASAPTLLAVGGSGVLAYVLGDTVYIRTLGRFGLATVFPASMSLFIVLTAVAGVMLLGEPFSPGLAVGAIGVLVGIWLLAGGNHGEVTNRSGVPTEVTMVAVIAVLWTAATIWLTWGQNGLAPVAVGALRTPLAAVALTAVALVSDRAGRRTVLGRRAMALGAAAAGVIGTGVGSLLYIVALQHAGAARTAVLSATSPVWGLPLAVFLLGERPTRRTAAGTALALGGALLVALV